MRFGKVERGVDEDTVPPYQSDVLDGRVLKIGNERHLVDRSIAVQSNDNKIWITRRYSARRTQRFAQIQRRQRNRDDGRSRNSPPQNDPLRIEFRNLEAERRINLAFDQPPKYLCLGLFDGQPAKRDASNIGDRNRTVILDCVALATILSSKQT